MAAEASHLRRTVAAAGLGLVMAVSGCGLSVTRPADPEVTPYSRPALRQGEAADYMESYSDRLGRALANDGEGLDQEQSGPLLDRTRAELLIAKGEDNKLGVAQFDSVVAGGPVFQDYPLWFIGFGHAADEEAGTQALLVTRESAASDWKAVQGLFIPNDQVPTLVSDENGAVAAAPSSFVQTQTTVNQTLVGYLAGGDKKDVDAAGIEMIGTAFDDFRKYVSSYSDGDNAFDSVNSDCKPYEDIDLNATALSTQDGAVGFGEVRCTITLEVAGDYAVTLSEAIKAVVQGDADGNKVTIETSVPYVVKTSGGAVQVIGSDWFLLEARTEKT